MKAAALMPLVLLGVCAALSAQESAPAFPVPVRPLGFDLSAPLPPVAVTGLDVVAPDGKSLAPPLRLREDGVYTLRVTAKYTESAGDQPLTLSAVLDSGGPVREAAVPVSGRAEGVALPVLELPLRLEPARGSGESVLHISATRVGDAPSGAVRSWPLAVFPAFVEPVPAHSTLDARRITEVFGEKAVLLDARFRLGKGASVELSLPPALAGVSIRAIGIVSSIAWLPRQDRNRSDLLLASLAVNSPEGEERFPLRLGVETLPVDGEFFAKKEALAANEVQVFSQWVQGRDDQARTRQNYAASCSLNTPRALKSIVVKHDGAVAVVQVDGVLLLPTE